MPRPSPADPPVRPTAHGPPGPVWWRFGRPGRHSLTEALDNPDNRASYDQRQAVREREQQTARQELIDSLACVDCGDVPQEESTRAYGGHRWTRRRRRPLLVLPPGTQGVAGTGGRRTTGSRPHGGRHVAPVLDVPGRDRRGRRARSWSCGRRPARTGPECPKCVQARAAEDLGPLVLPAPTKRELVAAGCPPRTIRGGRRGSCTRSRTRPRTAGCDLLVCCGAADRCPAAPLLPAAPDRSCAGRPATWHDH
jgi:hypothetical protein